MHVEFLRQWVWPLLSLWFYHYQYYEIIVIITQLVTGGPGGKWGQQTHMGSSVKMGEVLTIQAPTLGTPRKPCARGQGVRHGPVATLRSRDEGRPAKEEVHCHQQPSSGPRTRTDLLCLGDLMGTGPAQIGVYFSVLPHSVQTGNSPLWALRAWEERRGHSWLAGSRWESGAEPQALPLWGRLQGRWEPPGLPLLPTSSLPQPATSLPAAGPGR